MPSKKPNKAAKRPGKAAPKKSPPKVAAPKKKPQAKAPAKPTPIATPKVPVKQPKSSKAAVVKPPASKATRPKAVTPHSVAEEAKSAPEPATPLKFDSRPLVMPRAAAQSDDDGEENSGVASLLAGPR